MSVVIFDLDGTITRYDTYVRFLLYVLYRQPWKIIRLPGLAIDILRYKLGRQNNSWLKVRFLTALLAGLDKDRLDRWGNAFAQTVFNTGTYKDATACIKEHLEQKHTILLLSASFDLYVYPLGKLLGFEQIICTETAWQDSRLLNHLHGENCYGEAKLRRLIEWQEMHPENQISLAYADHASDLPLLQYAEKGLVINPDDKLRAIAVDNNLDVINWQ